MSQQELVHVPQQEVVSEHQRLMDQLLGIAPTVPQTVPVQPNTLVPPRFEFASPIVLELRLPAKQQMGLEIRMHNRMRKCMLLPHPELYPNLG
eukprot:342588-Amphidinium_carterae.1